MHGAYLWRSLTSGAMALGLAAVLANGAARAETIGRASVSMPFTCTHDAAIGRLRLQRSGRQIYEITDRRETQRFLVCGGDGGGEGTCRPWMLHRFVMQCGRHAVPWINVVAAAMAQRPGVAATIDDGQLVISRSVNGQANPSRDCFDRLATAPIRLRLAGDAWLEQCWRREQRTAMRHESRRVILPPGFAPAHLLGARFLPAARPQGGIGDVVAVSPAQAIAAPSAAPSAAPAAAAASVPTVAAVSPPASPEVAKAPSRLPTVVAEPEPPEPSEEARARQRITFVAAAAVERASERAGERLAVPAASPTERGHSPNPRTLPAAPLALVETQPVVEGLAGSLGPYVLAVLISGVLAALLGFGITQVLPRWKRRSPYDSADVDVPFELTFPRFSGPDGEAIEQLVATARDRLDHCRTSMRQLPPGLPLRQVMSREVHASIGRLSRLAGEAGDTPDDTRRIRKRLQTVARDLQRLALIADGALSSVGAGALVTSDLPEPRDRAEAYAVLGVNADVDQRTLKKLVDALRKSWHPDRARDETDRRRREERIKQINVAWDLIQGKRLEA